MFEEIWGQFQEETHCTRHTSFVGLEGILFFVVRIYPQDFDPLPIVEVTLPIGKWAFEEFINLQVKPQSCDNGELDAHEHL